MPLVTKHKDAEIRRVVRDAFFLNPLISHRQLIKILEDRFNKGFGNGYVLRLVHKVHLDIRREVDQLAVNDRIGQYREFVRMAKDALLKIAYGEHASDKNKTAAWHVLGALEKNLLEAEFDAGIYERKIGTVSVEHHVIDDTRKKAMIEAIRTTWAFNTPQPRQIEAMALPNAENDKLPIPSQNNAPEPRISPFTPKPLPADQGPVLPGRNGSATIIPARVMRPRVSANADGSLTILPA